MKGSDGNKTKVDEGKKVKQSMPWHDLVVAIREKARSHATIALVIRQVELCACNNQLDFLGEASNVGCRFATACNHSNRGQ